MSLGDINNKSVRKTISENTVKQKLGHKTYLLKDKEAYIVETSEIDVTHGLPRDIEAFTDKI